MKERPILFGAPMVRAILEGRKTQTRRIVKPQPLWIDGEGQGKIYRWKDGIYALDRYPSSSTILRHCPYSKPGDRLWVRETFYSWRCNTYSSAGTTEGPDQAVYAADGGHLLNGAKWKPSIHMPRWASRITLELTDVRVQRLQEISEEDAAAEGVEERIPFQAERGLYKPSFKKLWDCINGDGSWDANPWLWAITFKRIDA